MAGLNVALICVAASGHRGVSERGPAINQWPHPELVEYKLRKCIFLSSDSSCFFQLFPWVLPSIGP